MARGRTPSTRLRARFLAVLADTANVSAAAAAAGISRRGAYCLRDTDPAFARAWEDAVEASADALEQAARTRAIEGAPRYVTNRDGLVLGPDGQPVVQRHYSDALLLRLLAAARPDRYGPRACLPVDQDGPDLVVTLDLAKRRAELADPPGS